MTEGRVEALYASLKDMVVGFRIRPGERLNEVALARALDTSRTPLREALNRLISEQLIEFQPGRGFFCRDLTPASVFELYELRAILEVAIVRLATERADAAGIAALHHTLYTDGLAFAGRSVRELTAQDETFHIGIARLAGSAELVRQLAMVNDRIRYIRWIDMAERAAHTRGEHRQIMSALEARDADAAAALMRTHIERRMDQVVSSVRRGYAQLYVPGEDALFDQPMGGEDDAG
ncbi:GntR family transcriptional regulator [Hoeflea marina]|uniref:GntR family transcriptional regulator n=1 Tax=Hoeflea marina TaxID=274592 RepID=A0A317PFW4_9HYPH|nr:GntR family transcriptional regulator [Hoeflea marina]PWV98914.1 GntR family transcriptional regulator [Hoeflea marina]